MICLAAYSYNLQQCMTMLRERRSASVFFQEITRTERYIDVLVSPFAAMLIHFQFKHSLCFFILFSYVYTSV